MEILNEEIATQLQYVTFPLEVIGICILALTRGYCFNT